MRYFFDYLFDADRDDTVSVSGRKDWTVGMCLTASIDELEKEKFMLEHQRDNMSFSNN